MTRINRYGPSLLLLATVVTAMLAGPRVAQQIAWAQTNTRVELARESLTSNPALAELSDAFRRVAEVASPSVVNITIYSRQPAGGTRLRRFFFGPGMPFEQEGPDMQDLFPDDEQPQSRQGDNWNRYNPPRESANGSGWVYDNQGHVITNNHVIRDADRIVLKFVDGSEQEAKVVGSDPKTDVAVLKVPKAGAPPAAIAKAPVEQGEIVFAFGSPFGNEFSMSQGVVSAKGRQVGILREGYENFIQTDAAINPGNSGGPLTNIYGQVVGMNTAIATRSGAFAGIGFAIPVDMVQRIADQLITSGKVTRGYLGIYLQDLDARMARSFNFEGKGVLVQQPIDKGPAAEAGVQAGDIITSLNGQAVANSEQLRETVAGRKPGEKAELGIWREGKTSTVTVTVQEMPAQADEETGPADEEPSGAEPTGQRILMKLGFESVRDMTPAIAERLEVNVEKGVLVQSVRAGSAAFQAGIQPRQIVTHVGGRQVTSVSELAEALSEKPDQDVVRLRVMVPGPNGYIGRYFVLEVPKD